MLRSASELRNEREARLKKLYDEVFQEQLKLITEQIERCNKVGKTCVTVLSVSAEMHQLLVDNGYKVDYNRAAGMGDVDSYTISW